MGGRILALNWTYRPSNQSVNLSEQAQNSDLLLRPVSYQLIAYLIAADSGLYGY